MGWVIIVGDVGAICWRCMMCASLLVVSEPYTSHSSAPIANSHIPYRTTLPPDNPTSTERVPHDTRIRHTTHTFPTHGLVHRDPIRTTHRPKVYRQRAYLLHQQSKLQFPIQAPYTRVCTHIWCLGQVSPRMLHSQHPHTLATFTAFTRSHTRYHALSANTH